MKDCVKKIKGEKMEEYEIWKNKIKVILKLYKSFSAMLCNLDIYIYYIKKFIYLFFKYPIIPIGGLGSEILNEYTFTQFQNCKKHEKEFIEKQIGHVILASCKCKTNVRES